jgi:hypothetical protein
MTPQHWVTGRKNAKITQVQAAKALRLSQPYLSQLETGARLAGDKLSKKAATLYALPTALPLPNSRAAEEAGSDRLQGELAALGYPRFAHVVSKHQHNPAGVLLGAVVQQDLDTRLVEALPWVVSQYVDLDWPWLRDRVKLRNVQNRLGYIVYLAKEVVRLRGSDGHKIDVLSTWELDLEEARLAREDTLCRESMPASERSWLKTHRPSGAAHWNLLTSLTPEQLSYA